MTSHNLWELDEESTRRAIDVWRERDGPDRDLRLLVGEWIIDRLRADPLNVGRVDRAEGRSEVRFGRVPGCDVGVVFVVSRQDMSVSVAVISQR